MLPLRPSLDATLERMNYGRALKGELLMNRTEFLVPYAQPLLDAVSLFEELQIGYALIGGVAAMYYGRSRFTEDVDFVAVTGHMEVLTQHPAAMARHHFDPACTGKLQHQSGVQIDIWKDEHTDEIVKRSLRIDLAGRSIEIADRHDLVAMKLRAHRLKDDYDIAEIGKGMPLEIETLETLVTAEEFARFHEIMKRA